MGRKKNRKPIPTEGNVLYQRASSLYEDFSKGPFDTSDTKPFTAKTGNGYIGSGTVVG